MSTTATAGTVVNLCDDCYEHVSDGLLAECQDYCSLSLDHAGLCHERRETSAPCARCGDTDNRLTEHELQDDDETARMAQGDGA